MSEVPLLGRIVEGEDIYEEMTPRVPDAWAPYWRHCWPHCFEKPWGGRGSARGGRGSARAEDAQGTPTQSHVSPSILSTRRLKPFGQGRGGGGHLRGNEQARRAWGRPSSGLQAALLESEQPRQKSTPEAGMLGFWEGPASALYFRDLELTFLPAGAWRGRTSTRR